MLLLALLACTDEEEVPATPAYEFDALEEVSIETRLGTFVIEVDGEAAPVTHNNFLAYVEDGWYDGDDGGGATIFHRVISGFVAQGGGVLEDGSSKDETYAPIVNESFNGLSNTRGTIAMARTSDPDSATSQFYVNLVDNPGLDPVDGEPGYAVFGAVVEGMEVLDAIAAEPTGGSGVLADAPLDPVVILDATRL